MSRARDVVEVIAKALVDHPDSVQVDERVEHGGVRIELTTRSGDLGKLIGRRGRTASAVRALAEIAAERDGMRAAVDFLDEE
ncbi:MAG: KH domain-containing protein [Acidobacteria bacterium]|nr:KH domain-containing protein [Acidobacteriota bacterium]MYN66240.1 KH domain-containing protein [Acidobacteriota bacterium]